MATKNEIEAEKARVERVMEEYRALSRTGKVNAEPMLAMMGADVRDAGALLALEESEWPAGEAERVLKALEDTEPGRCA